jgi:hypothetical protein
MKRTQSDPTNRIYEQPISFFGQHNKMGSCAHTFPVASNEEFASHPANYNTQIKRGTALLKISFWFQKTFNLLHVQLVCLLDPVPTIEICWLVMKGLQKANAYWGGGATDCRLREVQLCCSWMSFALVVVVVGFSALLGGKIIALAFNGG